MKADINGLVRGLKVQEANWSIAVIEAVVNSMQAISDIGANQGRIVIAIRRDSSQQSLDIGEKRYPMLDMVTIQDNGIGLDSDHFDAFDTAHTVFRKTGKGMGRFTYLKCFNKCTISSCKQDNDELITAKYSFTKDGGLQKEDDSPTTMTCTGTIVELRGLVSAKPQFIAAEVLANHLYDHCILSYLNGSLPEILIQDITMGESVSVNDLLKDDIEGNDARREEFEVGDMKFRMLIRRVFRNNAVNELKLCAHERVVQTKSMSECYPLLKFPLKTQTGRPYALKVYIESAYLDDAVNMERTRFDIADATDSDDLFGSPSIADVCQVCVERIKVMYEGEMATVKTQRKEELRTFVRAEAPQFAYLLQDDNIDELLGVRVDGDMLTAKQDLIAAEHKWEKEHNRKACELLSEKVNPNSREEYLEHLQTFFAQESAVATSRLAHYVMHRKVILEMVRAFLENGQDTTTPSHVLEKELHNVLVPMGTTRLDLEQISHNLWMLDERLVTYGFISSDKKLERLDGIDATGKKEPDVLAVNYKFAADYKTGLAKGIVIVELKRPGLGFQAAGEKRPDEQVVSYVEDLIRNGMQKDGVLRPIRVQTETPKLAYVVCDYSNEDVEYIKTFSAFTPMPDGSFHKIMPTLNLVMTIMNYDTFLAEANNRNAELFRKLGVDIPLKWDAKVPPRTKRDAST